MKKDMQNLKDRLTALEHENKHLKSLFEKRTHPPPKPREITPVNHKEQAYNYETSTMQDRRKVPEDSIGASIEARGGAGCSLKISE